jgi:hypothetical protein
MVPQEFRNQARKLPPFEVARAELNATRDDLFQFNAGPQYSDRRFHVSQIGA